MSLARQPASQAAPWCKIEKDSEEEERERERGVRSRPLLCRLPLLGVGALVLDQCEGLLRLPACLLNGDGRRGKGDQGAAEGEEGPCRRGWTGAGAGAGFACLAFLLPSSCFPLYHN